MKKNRLFLCLLLSLCFSLSLGVWGQTETDYGELVFSVDFDDLSSVSSGDTVAQTASAFGGERVLLYNKGMAMNYGLASPITGGSQMLSMAAVNYHGCVSFQGYSLNKPGIYTLTYERCYANAVAYQSYAINAAPSTAQVVHSAPTLETIKTSVELNEGDSAITYVQIQFAKYQSGTDASPVYIDNVKLFYKPLSAKITVTVMHGSNETDVLGTHESMGVGSTVTLPTAEQMAAYTPNGMFLKGFSAGEKICAAGSEYKLTEADIQLGALTFVPLYAEIPDPGYGELVFYEDFEGASGTLTSGGYLPSLMRGTFAGKKVQFYDRGSGSSYTAVSAPTGEGQMLKISGGQYPQISLLNLGLSEKGLYTVMFDYYLPEDASVLFMQSGFNTQVNRWSDIPKGSVTTVSEIYMLVSDTALSSFELQSAAADPAFYIDNIRIYYEKNIEPVGIEVSSLRSQNPAGLRFVSYVSNAQRDRAEEYGYLLTLDDETGRDYENELVFGVGDRVENTVLTNVYDLSYISASNYIKGTKDAVYSLNGDFLPKKLSLGDGIYFTAAMTGIPETGFQTKLVVRPYIVYDGGVCYGNVVKRSLYEVALDIWENEDYTDDDYLEYILETVEGSNS